MSSNETRHLRITDFSDRELLALVEDNTAVDGWTPLDAIVDAIWPRAATEDQHSLTHARQCVGQRFRYMAQKGLMEHGQAKGTWGLTDLGGRYVRARLSVAQQNAINNSKDGQELLLAAAIGDLYERTADTGALLIRREFQFRQARRKAGVR